MGRYTVLQGLCETCLKSLSRPPWQDRLLQELCGQCMKSPDSDTDQELIQEALEVAVYSGHVECAKVMITRGADVNQMYRGCDQDITFLKLAAYMGFADCVELLVTVGTNVNMLVTAEADVNMQILYDITALLAAVFGCNFECNDNAGADVIKEVKDFDAAPKEAVRCGHVQCIDILIKEGG